jgi:Uma2 family endonuclease
MNMLTRAAEGLSRRAFTIADLERMEEAGIIAPDERLELIGGEIVPMAAKGNRHEAVKVAISRLWGRLCPPRYVVAQETGLRLDDHNYVEPDFVVFDRGTRLKDLKGPDVLLAVEVADSSLDYDLRSKPLVYASFGVRELWVIDAAKRCAHIHLAAGPEGYRDVASVPAGSVLLPRFAPADLAFALDALEEI